jgi:hypothetical protein
MAKMLAQAHIAARVDVMLRRARRFRAIYPDRESPIDLDHLQDFRDSLSPVKRRTFIVWIVLSALAIALPVAWAADRIRLLAPNYIVCSQASAYNFLSYLAGRPVQAVRTQCKLSSEPSLVTALASAAHVKLNPGGILDALQKLRLSGLSSVLLLVAIWILCISVVLLIFRSGFGLKRQAFLMVGHTPTSDVLPFWPETVSGGLYSLEREVFKELHIPVPKEFPLDLAVSVGVLVLPITVAVDLFLVTLPTSVFAPKLALMVAAVALVVAVGARLGWLLRVWRARTGSAKMPPPKLRLSNGSIVTIRGGVQGAIFQATVFAIWTILNLSNRSDQSYIILFFFLVSTPIILWASGLLWCIRVSRALGIYRDLNDLTLRQDLILLGGLAAATGLVITCILVASFFTPVNPWEAVFLLSFSPVCIYLTYWGTIMKVSQYRDSEGIAKRTRRFAYVHPWALSFVPVAGPAYVQYSFNQIWKGVAYRGSDVGAEKAVSHD